jgi:ABC-type branched-subunit amino acid transport system substrate-binding protein
LQFKEGVEQAVADINDAGGILGQKSPSSARPDAR